MQTYLFDATIGYLYTDSPSHSRTARSLELFRTLFPRVEFIGAKRRETWDGYLPEGVRYSFWERRLEHGVANIGNLGGLIRFLRRRLHDVRPDVVVVVNDEMAALFAAHLLPRPPVLVCDQFDSIAMRARGALGLAGPFLRRISRYAVSRVDALVEVSEERLGLYDRLPGRTLVVHNAPPVPRNVTPAAFPFPYVLVYGTLAEELQPLFRILRAVQEIDGLRIVSCGKTMGNHVRDEFITHPRVTFLDKVPYTTALSLAAGANAVFCHQNPEIAGFRHGAPTKLFEAMAFGKPILINSENSASTLALEAGIGRVTRYGDTAGIQAALREILEGRWRPDDNGEKAIRLFRTRFAWEHSIPRWIDLFRQLGIRASGDSREERNGEDVR
jgi:glycosyltransferase involved in cell wall biosynthesis